MWVAETDTGVPSGLLSNEPMRRHDSARPNFPDVEEVRIGGDQVLQASELRQVQILAIIIVSARRRFAGRGDQLRNPDEFVNYVDVVRH